ncbi:MAG: hypothetical protein BGO07_04815 [Alphaproteobacteria bacterium 40-19]|nr:MAG: hypothetical protein BGO07_04815 [Alphaproteobacteria bacterium 40-19]
MELPPQDAFLDESLLKSIEKLVKVLSRSGLSSFEYEYDGQDTKHKLRFHYHAQEARVDVQHSLLTPCSEEVPAAVQEEHLCWITAPLVGTAYLAAKPGDAPFVKEGDVVQAGQVLLILEAMKVMNPVKATISGTVAKVQVKDADPVEYGQHLIAIKPIGL